MQTVTESYRKNQINQYTSVRKDIVTQLKEEASKSASFSAMCHVLALRERSRKQITLKNIVAVMHKEGFRYEKEDYSKNLHFLATLGVGSVDNDIKGNFRSLKDIRFSLQKLGQAAVGQVAPSFIAKKVAAKQEGRTNVEIKMLGKTVTVGMASDQALLYLLNLLEEKRN